MWDGIIKALNNNNDELENDIGAETNEDEGKEEGDGYCFDYEQLAKFEAYSKGDIDFLWPVNVVLSRAYIGDPDLESEVRQVQPPREVQRFGDMVDNLGYSHDFEEERLKNIAGNFDPVISPHSLHFTFFDYKFAPYLQFDHHAFTRFKKQKKEDFISVHYPFKKKKVSVKGTAEQEEMVDALSPTGGGSGGETNEMDSPSSGSSYQTAADTCSSSSSSYQTATSTAEGDFPPVRSHQCEQRDRFDFTYRPHLDGNLLAKHARQNFKDAEGFNRYWKQRHELFSLMDDGVLLDYEGWFSVTPELVAAHVANRVHIAMSNMCGPLKREYVVLDAFTGAGGNAIQFALAGAQVIAVDMDPVKLRCALQNARVYDVQERINFICADFFHVARSLRDSGLVDVVFLSPPWGGPSYNQLPMVDIGRDVKPDGWRIFEAARQLSPNIVYFMPRNTNLRELIELAGPGGRVEVEQAIREDRRRVKAIHAYYGCLVTDWFHKP